MSLDDEALDRLVSQHLQKMLDPARGGALLTSSRTIREATSHDFSQYRLFAEPQTERLMRLPADGGTVGLDPDLLAEIAAGFAELFLPVLVSAVGTHVPQHVLVYRLVGPNSMGKWGTLRRSEHVGLSDLAIAKSMQLNGFGPTLAPELLALYGELGGPKGFVAAARTAITEAVASVTAGLVQHDAGPPPLDYIDEEALPYLSDPERWAGTVAAALAVVRRDAGVAGSASDEAPRLPLTYPFRTFVAGTVNFGLQVVYRQDWTPRGTQAGEIIRTLPLGPRQSERVTVEALHRTKQSMSSETLTATQSTTEASTATKDSSEVTDEASSSFNWHAEASGGFNVGYASASLKAGMGGESAESSKAVKSNLSEAMEKTTSQLRQETKIIVSTETEVSRQTSTVSEISNPNDEIAVTYVYSRLQRKYELHTYLTALNTCVMYAEPLPAPSELTGDWVRRHDWIISRALLDESFRADLDTVLAGSPSKDSGKDTQIASLMGTLTNGLPAPANVTGTVPDFYAAPQAAYEREVERERARAQAARRYRRALDRLQNHVYGNVLHYMRAIWAQEDADSRMLRYSSVRVPIRWTFTTTGSGTMLSGTWTPDVHDEARDTAPLSEIVDPAGPVAHIGNYAVLALASGRRYPGLETALTDMRLPYLRHSAAAVVSDQGVPVQGVAVVVGVGSDRRGPGSYRLRWDQATGRWAEDGSNRTFEPTGTGALSIDALRISITGANGAPQAPQQGWELAITVDVLPVLEDPELRSLRLTDPRPDPGTEAEVYSSEVLAEHAEFFADVLKTIGPDRDLVWADLNAAQQERVRARWPQYLLRRQHTRRLLLDTNNVLLTRYVDPASSLEPFRSVLRYVDVLQAYETAAKQRLDNERRDARIKAKLLDDPDIEKVVSLNGRGAVIASDGGPESGPG